MARVIVVGICGEAGSGKSSVAKYIREKYMARPLSFALPLKRICQDIWGFSDDQVFGEADVKEAADPRTGIVPRWAMKKVGEAVREHLGKDTWIEKSFEKIEEPGLYVIEDVRHLNEAKAISELDNTPYVNMDGYVIRLNCSDSISTDDGTHPSEAEVRLIPDEHLLADIHGSRAEGLDDLFAKVEAALKGVL